MTVRTASTAALAAALAVCLAAPAAAQTTASEADVKAEVRAAWDAYIEVFSAAQTDVIARDYFSAPSFRLTPDGATLLATEADTQASFDAIHRTLAAGNYDRSESDRTEVCVLNPSAAILSAHFTRYRTDGSVMLEGASAYLFARRDGSWRMLALIANPDRKLVACD